VGIVTGGVGKFGEQQDCLWDWEILRFCSLKLPELGNKQDKFADDTKLDGRVNCDEDAEIFQQVG